MEGTFPIQIVFQTDPFAKAPKFLIEPEHIFFMKFMEMKTERWSGFLIHFVKKGRICHWIQMVFLFLLSKQPLPLSTRIFVPITALVLPVFYGRYYPMYAEIAWEDQP